MMLFERNVVEDIEQMLFVGKVALSGPPEVDSLPPLFIGANFGSTGLTETSIVTKPREAVDREIVYPVEGTETPPICASM